VVVESEGTGLGGTSSPDPALAVLDVIDSIPAGRVMSYGDIAQCVGLSSARQVGQILGRHGHEVPWQRVVMADGSPAPHHAREQLAQLRADGTPLKGSRVDMAQARWQPEVPPSGLTEGRR
jgi:methylated-DNA-protein-cysteine methyltransferase-like protein